MCKARLNSVFEWSPPEVQATDSDSQINMQIKCIQMKNQSRQKGLDFLCADSGLLNTREVIKHQMYLFLKNTNNTLMATDIVQVAATKKQLEKWHSTTSGTLRSYYANSYSTNQKISI